MNLLFAYDHQSYIPRQLELAEQQGGLVKRPAQTVEWPDGSKEYHRVITHPQDCEKLHGLHLNRIVMFPSRTFWNQRVRDHLLALVRPL